MLRVCVQLARPPRKGPPGARGSSSAKRAAGVLRGAPWERTDPFKGLWVSPSYFASLVPSSLPPSRQAEGSAAPGATA